MQVPVSRCSLAWWDVSCHLSSQHDCSFLVISMRVDENQENVYPIAEICASAWSGGWWCPGVSLNSGRGPDVLLPAQAHLSAWASSSQWQLPLRSSPLPPRMNCTWPAWNKNVDWISPLFSPTLWSLKCDCSWIVAAFPWRFWHEKQALLSGLSSGQWSRTKPISLLTVGSCYQREWFSKHGGFLS